MSVFPAALGWSSGPWMSWFNLSAQQISFVVPTKCQALKRMDENDKALAFLELAFV